MKRSTFSKSFEEVFTTPRLLYELSQLKPRPIDYEVMQKEMREGNFFESAPKQSFFMAKNDGTFRQITLSNDLYSKNRFYFIASNAYFLPKA